MPGTGLSPACRVPASPHMPAKQLPYLPISQTQRPRHKGAEQLKERGQQPGSGRTRTDTRGCLPWGPGRASAAPARALASGSSGSACARWRGERDCCFLQCLRASPRNLASILLYFFSTYLRFS